MKPPSAPTCSAKLNFVSEALPLERLADAAKVSLIQRNAPGMRPAGTVAAPAAALPVPVAAAPATEGAR